MHKVKEIKEHESYYTIETSEGVKNVSIMDCDCLFRKSMMLPCRHIFALRKKLQQNIYDEALCNIRWTSKYYHETQRIFLNTSLPEATIEVTEYKYKRKHALSQHQKYRKAILFTSKLASVASEASGIHFHRRMKLLKELITSWKCGDEVALSNVDYGVFKLKFVSMPVYMMSFSL